MKQVIVMRKDLGMRAGKMVAQGGHAVHQTLLDYRDDPRVTEWHEKHRITKVTVRVESEQELLEIFQAAKDAGLISTLVTDSGLTEFHGVPTNTCIGVGPDTVERVDAITGHLRLL